MISLLIEKEIAYTEVEADALVARAKSLSKESGRTVRAEAELLLSTDRDTLLRDLRGRVEQARELLATIVVEIDELRAGSGDEDGALAAIVATMAASCEPFTRAPTAGAAPVPERDVPRTASSTLPVEP